MSSLNKLGKEMFTVTGRGGMLLILTFFYIGNRVLGVIIKDNVTCLQRMSSAPCSSSMLPIFGNKGRRRATAIRIAGTPCFDIVTSTSPGSTTCGTCTPRTESCSTVPSSI